MARPVITRPADLTLNQGAVDAPLSGFSVSDDDGGVLTLTLRVSGTLSLGVTAGLTFLTGDGTDDSELVFSGTIADLNAALATLTYTAPSVVAPDQLVIIADDGTSPALTSLSQLNGVNGFTVTGLDQGDQLGYAVSSAGDVNGDGFDDVVLGSWLGAGLNNARSGSGQAYVIFGSDSPFPTNFDLATLDGTNGFLLSGANAGDRAGFDVASAGDVNGDGIDDLIIGARQGENSTDSGSNVGEVHIVFGTNTGFAANLDLGALDGTNGFTIYGIDNSDVAGDAVSSIGDFNGDGFDDILIGAENGDGSGNSLPNAGEAYVVFGNGGGFSASIELSDLDGSNGFVLNGIDNGDLTGAAVSSAGDINGDGFDDLLIAALFADDAGNTGNSNGDVYVVFGTDASQSASFDLSNLNGLNGFTVYGADADDLAGISVSGLGDVNGDGVDDFVIGAYGGDGLDDSLNSAGQAHIVFGSTSRFGSSLDLSDLNGSNGFTVYGPDQNDIVGWDVSSAGDVNGDGIDDILVSAPLAQGNGNNDSSIGETHVIFGSSDGFAADLVLDSLDGENGFTLIGVEAGDRSGWSVSSAGDVNGDGFDDLVIGAYQARDATGTLFNVGESYIVYGSATIGQAGVGERVVLNIQEEVDPTLTVPGAKVFAEQSAGNAITGLSVEDLNGGTLMVRLSTTNGLTLSVTDGLTFTVGDGTLDSEMVFSGTVADINAALATLTYRDAGLAGDAFADSITIEVTDDGLFPTTSPVLNFADLDGTNGYTLYGADAGDRAGQYVSNIGDLNGDGIDDFAVAAPYANGLDNVTERKARSMSYSEAPERLRPRSIWAAWTGRMASSCTASTRPILRASRPRRETSTMMGSMTF